MNSDFVNTGSLEGSPYQGQLFPPDSERRNYLYKIFPYTNKELVEGVNWTDETLSYMRGGGTGNKIIHQVVKPIFGYNLTVVDATAGIGGETLLYALSKITRRVIAYEPLPDRHQMLVNNVKLYGVGHKVTTRNSYFDYKVPPNSVILLDPPFDTMTIEPRSLYLTLADMLPISRGIVLNAPLDFLFEGSFIDKCRAKVSCHRIHGKRVKVYVIRQD